MENPIESEITDAYCTSEDFSDTNLRRMRYISTVPFERANSPSVVLHVGILLYICFDMVASP